MDLFVDCRVGAWLHWSDGRVTGRYKSREKEFSLPLTSLTFSFDTLSVDLFQVCPVASSWFDYWAFMCWLLCLFDRWFSPLLSSIFTEILNSWHDGGGRKCAQTASGNCSTFSRREAVSACSWAWRCGQHEEVRLRAFIHIWMNFHFSLHLVRLKKHTHNPSSFSSEGFGLQIKFSLSIIALELC